MTSVAALCCYICGATPAPFAFGSIAVVRRPGPGQPAVLVGLEPRPLVYACREDREAVAAIDVARAGTVIVRQEPVPVFSPEPEVSARVMPEQLGFAL